MAIDPRSLVIRSLAEEMSTFDTVVDRTTAVRDRVIDKLVKSVDEIEVISLSDPEASAAQMGVITTTLRALSDQEAAATRRVTAKLRHSENQRADNTADNVIKLIQTISNERSRGGNGSTDAYPTINHDELVLDLERDLVKAGDRILDTELRTDPDDLAE